jgi:glyoxylate reductase
LAFALIISLARRIAEADHYIRSEKWPGWEPSQFLGADVYGATLGIIGLGRIGKALAKRGKGFDMNVIYWNRTRLSEEEEHTLGLTYRPMDEVLAQADFVSLHVAYTPDTHHLINKAAFSKMKDSGFIINTARGAVIDEQALVDALKNKEIAGAGLDVFEEEPKIHPDLLTMNNTVLLPHIGSASVTTRTKMGMIAVDNILAGCKGQKIPNRVN